MDLFENIKKIALANVIQPTYESTVRKLQRWFSSEFSVSILDVEELEIEFLLLHYYEHIFEQLEPKDRIKIVNETLESPDERKKRELEEEMDELMFLKVLEEEEEKRQKAELGKIQKLEQPKTIKPLDDISLEVPD